MKAQAIATAPKTGHVGLNVSDLERSERFYRQVFGFDVLGREEGFVFLGDAGRVVLTLWQQADDGYADRAAGLHHLSFEVASVQAVERAEKGLRALGVRFAQEGVVAHGPEADSGGIFFFDPDGIRLEIFTGSGIAGHAGSTDAPPCGFF